MSETARVRKLEELARAYERGDFVEIDVEALVSERARRDVEIARAELALAKAVELWKLDARPVVDRGFWRGAAVSFAVVGAFVALGLAARAVLAWFVS